MIKRLLWFYSLLAVGCSAQPKTVHIVDFENVCNYPVEISVREYSNGKGPFAPGQSLAAGESVEVLSYISFSERLEESIPDAYRLDIEAQGKSVVLDKESFLAQLTRSSVERKGHTPVIWKIRDTTLCP
ncbi:hypothetical protein [Ectopseudomonas guguanensis]|jgi:hypothetical protein|uniref:Lipoprotein n=1 Tax=Ectopseudomonas guguanensis TaxID=1198456 RepID=A0A1H0WWC8_9GAMM|nr:hypothetical protein [Pseudomonas guguanensis]SDP95074.1 hypothetical protein SAMN05216213_10883 [Pseudomonas guguanensis]